jgi:hypothetical protein
LFPCSKQENYLHEKFGAARFVLYKEHAEDLLTGEKLDEIDASVEASPKKLLAQCSQSR